MNMADVLGALGLGFLMGGAHVLMGPDHLSALACLCSPSPRRAWILGLRWSLGHTGGVLLVAAAVGLLRGFLDVDAVAGMGEKLVGLTLIALGVWSLLGAGRAALRPPARPHAALAVGTLHGAAGSSHILGVLPGLAQPSPAASAGYLAGFALGTVAAMTAFAASFAFARRPTPDDAAAPLSWLVRSTACLSIACGVAWLALPALGVELP